jgi:hypothetical protein
MSGFGQTPESFVVNVVAANDFFAVVAAATFDEVIDRLAASPAAKVMTPAPARSQRVALMVLLLLMGLVEGWGKIGSALVQRGELRACLWMSG